MYQFISAVIRGVQTYLHYQTAHDGICITARNVRGLFERAAPMLALPQEGGTALSICTYFPENYYKGLIVSLVFNSSRSPSVPSCIFSHFTN